jgi:hypothetical protein
MGRSFGVFFSRFFFSFGGGLFSSFASLTLMGVTLLSSLDFRRSEHRSVLYHSCGENGHALIMTKTTAAAGFGLGRGWLGTTDLWMGGFWDGRYIMAIAACEE